MSFINPQPCLEEVTIQEPLTVDANNFDIRDLVFATDKVDVSGSTVDPLDDFDSFEAIHQTIPPNTDVTVTFAQPVRLLRISNWDISNRILVKDGVIVSNSDGSAARVGKALVTS